MIDLKLFCKEMPKCEFNVRWEACIGRSGLRSLEEHRRVIGKPELTTEQRKLLWAYGKPRDMKDLTFDHNMADMIDLYCTEHDQDSDRLYQRVITVDIIKYFYADNVVYLELHVKPRTSKELSPELFLRKIIQAISFAKLSHDNITIKVLLIAEVEESIEKVREVIDLLLIFGKTHRNQNSPDGEIIHGVEIIFANVNDDDMRQLKKMVEYVRQESDLVIVFNLAKVCNNANLLYNILLLRPDRLCNVEILSQNENKIDEHVLVDRLLAMKLPIGDDDA
ncbi:unnamed protein product [Litomosoides sigmodontis]|uniref:Uncharacterized protein n=1 Tax=Litomosoides sigmodontis TaxID=42156 RepID=A0A3P6TYP2_LITSI|nr:unnamed protein product [Litomosoides sigmodontis]